MKRRIAFTLVELTLATALLAALLATSLQMLHALSDHKRSTVRRAIAMQAVQAMSEQIGNLPWDQLTTESAQHFELLPDFESRLPGAKVAIAVAEEPMPVASKRITVALTWTGAKGEIGAPVRLTSWVFPDNRPRK